VASLLIGDRWLAKYRLVEDACSTRDTRTAWGSTRQATITGEIRGRAGLRIRQSLHCFFPDEHPDCFALSVEYAVDRVLCTAQRARYGRFHLDPRGLGTRSGKPLWSFQGASLSWGRDEILPLDKGFSQQNSLAMHDAAEQPSRHWHYRQKQMSVDRAYRVFGGGIPLVDVWGPEMGIAVGVAEPDPMEMALPVRVDRSGIPTIAIERRLYGPDRAFTLPRIVFLRHSGDCYHGVRRYADFMRPLGFCPAKSPPRAYSPSWCGYGYNFDFQKSELTGVVPLLKQLNLSWVTIDERWFDNYGDWQPRTDTFPDGVKEFKDLVKRFHAQGFQVQLWWMPLAVELGSSRYQSHRFSTADVARRHPDWILLDEKRQPAVGPRGLNFFCPAVPEVQEYFSQIARRFVSDWNIDGHKLDAIYSVPPCFNPTHGHATPEESIRAFPRVFQRIFEVSQQLKPDALMMICPCGTPPNLHLLPWMNQPVTADPITPEQLRWRTKYLKALLGDGAPVYGDHVELLAMKYDRREHRYREVGTDFASALGTGAVPGTRFVWPSLTREQIRSEYLLDAAKETHWQRWLGLYRAYPLADGEYRSLYRIGYDFPEGHAIARNGRLYYAFYLPTRVRAWGGTVELRGLEARRYRVYDYERQVNLGVVAGPTGQLKVRFRGHLLLEAAAV
jgi:alpha-galactosidase